MGIRNAIEGTKWHWSYQKPWVTMSKDGQKSEIRVFWLHAIDKVVGRENDFAPKKFQNMHRVHNTLGNFKEMATISFRYSILLGRSGQELWWMIPWGASYEPMTQLKYLRPLSVRRLWIWAQQWFFIMKLKFLKTYVISNFSLRRYNKTLVWSSIKCSEPSYTINVIDKMWTPKITMN